MPSRRRRFRMDLTRFSPILVEAIRYRLKRRIAVYEQRPVLYSRKEQAGNARRATNVEIVDYHSADALQFGVGERSPR